MKARLTQLLARYLTIAFAAVAAWFGVSDQASGDLALPIAAAVVAAATHLVDLLIHKAATGGITKPAGAKK